MSLTRLEYQTKPNTGNQKATITARVSGSRLLSSEKKFLRALTTFANYPLGLWLFRSKARAPFTWP